jgi:glycosyltransferase involved in cell wall biosynthesis
MTQLAGGLLRRGHACEVAVVDRDAGFGGWLVEAGVPFRRFGGGRFRDLRWLVATTDALTAHVRETRPDVVVSNMGRGHLLGGLAAWRASIPAVWWSHGVPTRRGWWDQAAAFVPSAAVVAVSRKAAEAHSRLARSIRPIVIHNGVNRPPASEHVAERTAVDQLRQKWSLGYGPLILSVNRLEAGKRHDLVIRAVKHLLSRFPDVGLVIAGGADTPPTRDCARALLRLVHDLGLQRAVTFVGHQDPIWPWYELADVVVNAADGDSFGLVTVEAMLAGRPVVAAASGGTLEIIRDGHTGLLFAPGDAEALAERMGRVLANRDLQADLAAHAAHEVMRFSPEAMTEQFEALLSGLCDRA